MAKTSKKWIGAVILTYSLLLPLLAVGQDVEYDLSTNQFNRSLPFDQSFHIKLKNIPDSINSIAARFVKIPSPYVKRLKATSYSPITYTDIFKDPSSEIYYTTEWERANPNEEEGFLLMGYYLQPNEDYAFEINPSIKANLSKKELKDLQDCLEKHSDLNTFFVDFVENNNQKAGNYKNNIAKMQEAFNVVATEAVKNCDPSGKDQYTFTGTGFTTANLKRFAKISDRVFNVAGQINSTIVDAKKLKLSEADIAKLTNLQNTYNDLKWVLDKSILDPVLIGPNDLEYTQAMPASVTSESEKAKYPGQARIFNDRMAEVNRNIGPIVDSIQAIREYIIENVILASTFKVITVTRTYQSELVDNARSYISFTAGLSYPLFVDRLIPYVGANIYFRPINRAIPLKRYFGFRSREFPYWATHTSLLLALTAIPIEREGIRKGVIDNKGLIIGVGHRLNSFPQINLGGLMYMKHSTNPLANTERQHLRISPFIGLSLDLDVKPLFSGLGQSLFKTGDIDMTDPATPNPTTAGAGK